MKNRIDEIQDDELRVIVRPSAKNADEKPKKWLWAICTGAVCAAVAVVFAVFPRGSEVALEPDFYDQSTAEEQQIAKTEPLKPIGDYSDTLKAYTEHVQQTVNDILLDIYIPHNAKPMLSIGTPDIHDKSIIFVTQAADIRADNGKINGAFVLAGEPKAWGLSKKGYVAILDNKITVGVSENSPLFEEATEKGGYFFRQYPLVDNGAIVENVPKGKAVRKAICDRSGEIILVFSTTPESFHDFSQALVDFGVDNAVYLVGSEFSYGYYRDKLDHFVPLAEKCRGGQKYENYIKWVKE